MGFMNTPFIGFIPRPAPGLCIPSAAASVGLRDALGFMADIMGIRPMPPIPRPPIPMPIPEPVKAPVPLVAALEAAVDPAPAVEV